MTSNIIDFAEFKNKRENSAGVNGEFDYTSLLPQMINDTKAALLAGGDITIKRKEYEINFYSKSVILGDADEVYGITSSLHVGFFHDFSKAGIFKIDLLEGIRDVSLRNCPYPLEIQFSIRLIDCEESTSDYFFGVVEVEEDIFSKEARDRPVEFIGAFYKVEGDAE